MTMVDPNDPFKGLRLTSDNSTWLGRFLCRRGFHSWQFLYMDNVRMPAMQWSGQVCTIAESCRRKGCGIRRTRKNAKPPKRVKT